MDTEGLFHPTYSGNVYETRVPGEFAHSVDPFYKSTHAPKIPDATDSTGSHVSRSLFELRVTTEDIVALLDSTYLYWDGSGKQAPITNQLNYSLAGKMFPNDVHSTFVTESQTVWAHRWSYDIRLVKFFILHTGSFTTNYQIYVRVQWTAKLLVAVAPASPMPTKATDVVWQENSEQYGFGPNRVLDEVFLYHSDTVGAPVSFQVTENHAREGREFHSLTDKSGNEYHDIRVVSSGLRVTNLNPLASGLWMSRSFYFDREQYEMVFMDGETVFNGDHGLPHDFDVFQNAFLTEMTFNTKYTSGFRQGASTQDTSFPEAWRYPLNNFLEYDGRMSRSLWQDSTQRFWRRRFVDNVRFNYFQHSMKESSGSFFDTSKWAADPTFEAGSFEELSRTKQWNVLFTGGAREYVPVKKYPIQWSEISPSDLPDYGGLKGQYFYRDLGSVNVFDPMDLYVQLREEQGYRPLEDLKNVSFISRSFEVKNPTWLPPSFQYDEDNALVPVPLTYVSFAENLNPDTWVEENKDNRFRVGDRMFWQTVNMNRFGWEPGDTYLGHCPLSGTTMEDFVDMTFPRDQRLTMVCFDDIRMDPENPQTELVRVLLDSVTNFEVHKDASYNNDFTATDPSAVSSVHPHHAALYNSVRHQLPHAVRMLTGLPSSHHGFKSDFSLAASQTHDLGLHHGSGVMTASSTGGSSGFGSYDPYDHMMQRVQEQLFEGENSVHVQELMDKLKENERVKGIFDKMEEWLDKHSGLAETLGIVAALGAPLLGVGAPAAEGGAAALLSGAGEAAGEVAGEEAAEAAAGEAAEAAGSAAAPSSSSRLSRAAQMLNEVVNTGQDLTNMRTAARLMDIRGAENLGMSAFGRLRNMVSILRGSGATAEEAEALASRMATEGAPEALAPGSLSLDEDLGTFRSPSNVFMPMREVAADADEDVVELLDGDDEVVGADPDPGFEARRGSLMDSLLTIRPSEQDLFVDDAEAARRSAASGVRRRRLLQNLLQGPIPEEAEEAEEAAGVGEEEEEFGPEPALEALNELDFLDAVPSDEDERGPLPFVRESGIDEDGDGILDQDETALREMFRIPDPPEMESGPSRRRSRSRSRSRSRPRSRSTRRRRTDDPDEGQDQRLSSFVNRINNQRNFRNFLLGGVDLDRIPGDDLEELLNS